MKGPKSLEHIHLRCVIFISFLQRVLQISQQQTVATIRTSSVMYQATSDSFHHSNVHVCCLLEYLCVWDCWFRDVSLSSEDNFHNFLTDKSTNRKTKKQPAHFTLIVKSL